MPEWSSILILSCIGVYAILGIAFAAWFVGGGVGRIDQAAARGPIGFRLIIVPGVAALWVVLAALVWRTRKRGKAS